MVVVGTLASGGGGGGSQVLSLDSGPNDTKEGGEAVMGLCGLFPHP